jgi:hypothetical protein
VLVPVVAAAVVVAASGPPVIPVVDEDTSIPDCRECDIVIIQSIKRTNVQRRRIVIFRLVKTA